MKNDNKTKEQFLNKISKLNDKIDKLEKSKTEHKQAEKELRVKKGTLQNVFEAMEDGIYIGNQQYDIQYVNAVLIKDFGIYDGKKCYEYFHDRKEVCSWCKSRDVFAGKTVRWEWTSAKNGKTYDLIDTPLKNPDGSISKLEIFRDITERKRAEKKLRASEENYRLLVDNTDTGFVIVDDKGIVVEANDPYLRLVGAEQQDDIIGRSVIEWTAPESKEENAAYIALCAKQGYVKDFETTYLRNDGTRVIILIDAIMHETSEGKRLSAQCRDITERKQAEDKLISRNKELELFNEVTVGRELKMIELKKEINELFKKSGKKTKYEIPT